VKFNGDWLEVLGCGVIHDEVLGNSGLSSAEGNVGWAFGLGLERLAMILFSIPDIRLFWSTDDRFISQFTDGVVKKFVPYSKFPECYKDVSFWLPESEDKKDSFHPNDVYEVS
jgi:phenylalanyl-tRNA synthetase alpha chain